MGRQILEENTKFTNEIVHSIKSKDVEGMILKLDFQKVFDYVDQEFLFNTMKGMGFENKWIFWIRSLFSTIKTSVQVIDYPTDEF